MTTTSYRIDDVRNVCRVDRGRRGFTVIEMLIVVIILGMLAAIVIPPFASASRSPQTTDLQATVQALRSEIGIYRIQHGDTLPDLVGQQWAPLISRSAYAGQAVGPYLHGVPENPLTRTAMPVIKNGTSAAAVPGADFVYDYAGGSGSGNIWGTSNQAAGTIVP